MDVYNANIATRRLFVAAQHARSPECVNATEVLYKRVHAFARDRRRCTLTNIISRQVLLTEAAMSSEFGALLLTAIPKAASSTLLKVALPSIAPLWRRPREFGKANSTTGVRASVIDLHLSDCRLLRAILERSLRSAGNRPNSTSSDSSIVHHTNGTSSRSWHAVVVREPFGRALSAVREVLETQCARWHEFNVARGRHRVHARWSVDFGNGGGNISVELAPGTVRKPGSTHPPSERCVLQHTGNTSRWWAWDTTPTSALFAYRAILNDLRLGFDNAHLVPQSLYLRQSLVPPDAILRAESLDVDWQALLESVGLRSNVRSHTPGLSNHGLSTRSSAHAMGSNAVAAPTTSLSQLRHRPDRWKDPSLGLELGATATKDFCTIFRADYVCLGYPMPRPCEV